MSVSTTVVSLNDEMESTLQEDPDVPSGIISGIKPEEQVFIRQLVAEADCFLQKLWRILLAVLFPFA